MKKSLISLLFLAAACSSEDSIAPNPVPEKDLLITFSENSIDINSIDSAFALLTNGEASSKRYFEKANNSLVVSIDDITGTWEADLFIYTKASDNDYPRQYSQKKAFIVNDQPVYQVAPTGSIIDAWYPRILVADSDVSFLVGIAPEDPMVLVAVTAENKWDYFSISKLAHYRNGNSVLVGSTSFEVSQAIQPPGIINITDLDLVGEIADKEWNEIEIYGTLLDNDNETEERPFYYRIAL